MDSRNLFLPQCLPSARPATSLKLQRALNLRQVRPPPAPSPRGSQAGTAHLRLPCAVHPAIPLAPARLARLATAPALALPVTRLRNHSVLFFIVIDCPSLQPDMPSPPNQSPNPTSISTSQSSSSSSSTATTTARLSQLTNHTTQSPTMGSATVDTLFTENVVPQAPEDPLFGLMAAYRKDTFDKKVDLGIGAYRDNNAKPWVLPVVKKVCTFPLKSNAVNHSLLLPRPTTSSVRIPTSTTNTCLSLVLLNSPPPLRSSSWAPSPQP